MSQACYKCNTTTYALYEGLCKRCFDSRAKPEPKPEQNGSHPKYSKAFVNERRAAIASMLGWLSGTRKVSAGLIRDKLAEKGFYPQLQTIRADLRVLGWKIEGKKMVRL